MKTRSEIWSINCGSIHMIRKVVFTREHWYSSWELKMNKKGTSPVFYRLTEDELSEYKKSHSIVK